MTKNIGIRELKAQASRIVDEVHEKGARYIVTKRGEPVGELRPYSNDAVAESGPWPPAHQDAWAELAALGREISAGLKGRESIGETLSRMRD